MSGRERERMCVLSLLNVPPVGSSSSAAKIFHLSHQMYQTVLIRADDGAAENLLRECSKLHQLCVAVLELCAFVHEGPCDHKAKP